MKTIYIKDKVRRKEEFQFFMHDFIDSCKVAGFSSKSDLFPSYKWHIRAVCREIWLEVYLLIHRFLPFLIQRKKALMVCANGVNIKDNLFPYYFGYEIVPMLWDVWPSTWERMYDAFRLFDVKTVFVTASQVADMINKETTVKAYWVPEGIDVSHYHKGRPLSERDKDVFEMGRQMKKYHEVLLKCYNAGGLHGYQTSNINADGTLNDKHVAFSNKELYAMMPQYKVMVCFPQCDTNPARGGNIETLTQRYWEAMLSGCIMIGRAPKELVDLIGYNPVVDVDWANPEDQLIDILRESSAYQGLADKNYRAAQQFASWQSRMPMIKKYLQESGYLVL